MSTAPRHILFPGDEVPVEKLYLLKPSQLSTGGHFQSLRYEQPHCKVMLQTKSFYGYGPYTSKLNNKRQMFLPEEAGVHSTLRSLLEKVCKQKVICPVDAWKSKFENGSAWKDIENFYPPLASDCTFYNENKEVITIDQLGEGHYTLLLHVCGQYMGTHGNASHVASMTLKVVQILYEKNDESKECLIR